MSPAPAAPKSPFAGLIRATWAGIIFGVPALAFVAGWADGEEAVKLFVGLFAGWIATAIIASCLAVAVVVVAAIFAAITDRR